MSSSLKDKGYLQVGDPRTIFVTASLPMNIRNLLRTGVLLSLCNDYRVVLLAPFVDDTFSQEFGNSKLIFKRMPPEGTNLSSAGNLWYTALQRRHLRENKVDTQYFAEKLTRLSSLYKYYYRTFIDLLNRKGSVERFAGAIQRSLWKKITHYQEYFEEYRPIAVISTHPYLPSDWPILWQAQKRNICTIGMIHSWDNVTVRGALPFRFDRLIVWSELMKKEALRSHSWLREETVSVTGSSQFDLFVDRSWLIPRKEFMVQRGLDPDRALITFAGGNAPHMVEPQVIGDIISLIEEDRLCKPAQLWIRFYGGENYKLSLPIVENHQNVKWEQASAEFWGAFRVENAWKGGSGFDQYLNLLYHSDVVVCFASTVSLDAAVLDRPVVNVAYDGHQILDFMHSVRRLYFSRDHYQRVLKSGGVRIAFDLDELNRYLNLYLTNPGLDCIKRQELVEELIGQVDGKIRERVVRAIIDSIASS